MTMSVKEVKAWIDTLDLNSTIAIDDEGLTILEFGANGDPTGSYLEIGGCPNSGDE